jgi:hypothetical protein
MTEVVSRNYRLNNARQFFEMFGESTPTNLYLFVGKTTPWSDDANPPSVTDTPQNLNYSTWQNMLGMKKAVQASAILSITRIDWTTATVYTMYDDQAVFNNSSFYVMTDANNVYKCLFNNNGAASTVKPTGTSGAPVTLGDGYIWKYMFTVSSPDALNFLTTDFIPVKTLTSDDGTTQWTIQSAAIDGGIHVSKVTAGGTGYVSNSGTAQAGAASTITLATGASATNNIYNGYGVYILSGAGAGQYRTISAYNGTTKVATVSVAWTTQPTSASTYVVSPLVTFVGDGTSAVGYSNVTAGAIASITMTSAGINYRRATITIGGTTGSGAGVRPILSPIGGHGKDPVAELYATNCTVNIRLSGTESGTFFTGNDFRITGIIADPFLADGVTPATALTYDTTTKLNISGGAGTFTNDETVTGATSGATATVVKYDSGTVLSVVNTNGTFTNGETLTGTTSGATTVMSTKVVPLVKPYTGNPIYVRYSSPTTRNASQQENFRITAKF